MTRAILLYRGKEYIFKQADLQLILNALEIVEPDKDSEEKRASRLEAIFRSLVEVSGKQGN